jgi:hypothetical protein
MDVVHLPYAEARAIRDSKMSRMLAPNRSATPMAPHSKGTHAASRRAKVTTPRAMLVARNAPRPRYSCANACWPRLSRLETVLTPSPSQSGA